MTSLATSGQLRKSPAGETAISVGLIIVSLIAGLAIVELFCRLFTPIGHPVYQWDRRIMFVDGAGTVFENHGPIFTYTPHDDIRDVTVYFSDRDFTTEYDYRFHTNNYGLVQDADVEPKRPSLLLLGDSFTEGEGAPPWFRQLAARNGELPYQLVNGGLRGTGFAQWSLLEQYLTAAQINVAKLIVLFISDDMTRPVRTISPTAMDCLRSLSSCSDEEMYQLPTVRLPPATDMARWVDKFRTLRAEGPLEDRLAAHAATVMPATLQVYHYLQQEFGRRTTATKRASRETIAAFVREHGAENVAFVHLPQKDEINGPDQRGLEERQAIKDAGGRLYDGFKLCGLTPADYHVRDGHPNQYGYQKIARCVGDIVRGMTAADRQSTRQGD